MLYIFTRIVFYLVVLFFSGWSAEYYVSVTGDDNNPGTIDQPFRTVTRAASVMRAGDICFIRGGYYHEDVIIENLHGTSGSPIIFTAFQNEQVWFDGTEPITTSWTKYKGSIYKTTLSFDVWQLFLDNEEMIMARWPNARFDDGTVWDQKNHWGYGHEDKSANGILVDEPHGEVNLAASGLDVTGAMAILNVGSFIT